MKRICFQSMQIPMDTVSSNYLRNELIHLAETNEKLEFWFTKCRTSLEEVSIAHIIELRTLFPSNQIDIVAVIDPVRNEHLSIGEFCEYNEGFPRGSVSKTVYAPRIEGKSELLPNRFINHLKKFDRWMIEQCDILFAYYYDDIPDSINTDIKQLKKRGKTEVVRIFNPDIEQIVSNYIDNLEGRDGIVLRGLKEGRTLKSIGTQIGISPKRVQQISYKVARSINKRIREAIS